jgi:hypothetical protein
MSSLTLLGDTSGSVVLDAPAVAGSSTLTLPARSGTVMVNGPAFSAYRSGSNQSISTGTWTKVQLNSEQFDTANCFDSTTNYRFTPTVAGYYQINGSLYFNGTSTVRGIAGLYKNGSIYQMGNYMASYNNTQGVALVISLVYFNGSTDYIELYGLIQATSPVFIDDNTAQTLSGYLARSA